MSRKREPRKRPPEPVQVANAGIVWVEEAERGDPGEGSDRPARVEENQADRVFLERIFGADRACCVETVSSSWHFSPSDHARAVKTALAHPGVSSFLQGRWGVLGADQVWARPSATGARQRVRVHLFDYSSSRMVAVMVEDDRVVSVEELGVHEYPESPQEMGSAIEIARSHPVLSAEVRELEGHAILRVPSDSRDASLARRCMWVMFTEPDDPTRQLPTLYTALVDLSSQEVIACGATPCGEASSAASGEAGA